MATEDVDIFATGREMQRGSYSPPQSLDLTPAQTAYLAGALVDPQGAADFTGNYFEFPTSNMSIKDMLEGPRAPSFFKNLRQRNFGDAAFQGVGALPIPFLAGAAKYFKAASKIGKEVDPRILRATEQGYDFDNVMYHASKQDIKEFVPGYDDGLTFLTPSPEFASNWLGKGKFKERQGDTGAVEGVKAERRQFSKKAEEILESLPKDQRQQYFEEVISPQMQQLLKDEKLSDSAIYPVVTKTKKPFVPSKDVDVLEELFGKEKMESKASYDFPTLRDDLRDGNYLLYENKEVVDFLKSKGYDSMFLKESSGKDEPFTTFAVFEPKDIRSVNAQFSNDPDLPPILKSEGGSVDDEDIFGYSLGGSISEDMRKIQGRPEPEPFLSPARAAYFAAQFPFGAGTLDAIGEMNQLPDIKAIDPFSGAPGVSMAENLAQRNYLDFGLQGMSVLGDAAYGVPIIGPPIAGALKVPRAIQKLLQAGETLGQAERRAIDELREATEAFDLKKSQLEAEGVDPYPQLVSLKENIDVKSGNLRALNIYVKNNPEATGFVVPSYEQALDSLEATRGRIRTNPEDFDQRLLFLHQTDREKMTALLEGDNKMPSPSIAVLDKDQSFEGYGDIDLIGNPNAFDPKNPENPMYKSDAWTPTTGAVYRLAAPDSLYNFQLDFSGYKDIDPEAYNLMEYKIGASSVQTPSDIDPFGTNFNGDPFHAKDAKNLFMSSGIPQSFDNLLLTKFFKDKYDTDYVNDVDKYSSFDGQLVKTGMSAVDSMDQKSKERILKEFNSFKDELFQKYFPNLYTDSYDGPVPFDADEVAAEMGGRSQILGEIGVEGEMDDIANISQLLAASTEATPIQSLAEAKAVAEGRLLRSGESMPAAFTASSELQREFYDSYGKIQDIITDASFDVGEGYLNVPVGLPEELISQTVRSGGSLDTIEEIVNDIGPVPYSVDDVPTNLPDDVLKKLTFELKKLYDKVHGVDVKYFESKPTRAVKLDEFVGAIVPQREKGIIEKLKDKGLKVVTYTSDAEKQEARKQFKDQMFSIGGAGALGGTAYMSTQPDSVNKEDIPNLRIGGPPIPYRRGYRGPIDPSFNYGQAPQMFGRMFANRVGIGALPFIGRPATNLFSRGFSRLGQFGQRLPGGRQIGNFLNRIARPVNRITAFQDRMNPQNVMTSGIGRLFGGGNQQGGKGMFGLRGKGGLLGFGLLGGRGTPRQVARQQYGGSPSILGSGAFASSYAPKIGEDVVTGRQDSSTRNVPNYTGTIESGDFDIFDTPAEPAIEYSFARAPRGSIIGTSGFASNIPYARISSLGGGGGFGGSGASSGGFGGGFTFKKEHAQDAGG